MASFVPILLYGVLSLSTGCLLANRKSSVYTVLTSCVEKLRFRGASRDLLLGRSRGFLRMFGPVDLIDPKYQYHIVTTSDFLELSTAIYVSRNTGSHFYLQVRWINECCWPTRWLTPKMGVKPQLAATCNHFPPTRWLGPLGLKPQSGDLAEDLVDLPTRALGLITRLKRRLEGSDLSMG